MGPARSPDRNEKLLEAGMALASELSLDGVLQRIVELAVDITEAKYGALGVLTPEGLIEEFITVGVSAKERAAIGDPPVGKGILGVIIEEHSTLRLADIWGDIRSVGFPANHPPMRSFLGAPVMARGEVFGRIYLTEKQTQAEFDQQDEESLEMLAAQAGVAIENARLHEETVRAREERRRLAVLEERERIARELHDGAIQSLFAVGMGLQGIAEIAADEAIAERLEESVSEVDRVIRDLRNYIFGLRPGILADRQLDQAIRDLARDFEEKSGIATAVDIDIDLAAELASRAGDAVQITREALSNIGRHSGAQTCSVSLYREDSRAVLEIDDDGKGFAVAGIPGDSGSGNGLRNIRERAEALGGSAEIRSSSEGTNVRLSLPI